MTRLRGELGIEEPALSIVVKIEDTADEATRRLLDDGLDTYNFSRAGGPSNAKDLWFVAHDVGGTTVGVLKTKTFYSWMFIDLLWVLPSARGGGIGSMLMDQAEAIAREQGCIGAYVDTFSFQAPDFYRRRGYEEFGRLEQLPPGHAGADPDAGIFAFADGFGE